MNSGGGNLAAADARCRQVQSPSCPSSVVVVAVVVVVVVVVAVVCVVVEGYDCIKRAANKFN